MLASIQDLLFALRGFSFLEATIDNGRPSPSTVTNSLGVSRHCSYTVGGRM